MLDFYSTNSLSWEQLDYNNGCILNLHYGLIHKGLPTMVDLSSDNLPFIEDSNIPRSYTLCRNGDVAFADASEDTNDVAKAIEFMNCDGKDIVCGLHTIHGRDKSDSTIVGYKGYAFASNAFHRQIRRIAQGTKIYSINIKNFTESYIGVPAKREQEKIAALLLLIDKRISTQNKIIEDLKKLMSAIYLNVFGKLSVKTSSLGELVEISKGKQINGTELLEEGLYYMMNGGTSPSGFLDSYNTESNAISISEGGNSCGYVQYNKSRFWSGGHCYTLSIKKSAVLSTCFLYHYLKWKENNIMALRIGSGLPNIQKKDLTRFPILLPNIELQKHLEFIFASIEQKAECEIAIAERYEQQKQYLLQQMFI